MKPGFSISAVLRGDKWHEHLFFLIPGVLILVYIIPFKFNCLLDMPDHMARAYIMLKHVESSSNSIYNEFSIRFVPVAFILADITLMVCLKLFSILTAEKIALTFALLLLVTSWYIFYKTANKCFDIGYLAGLSLIISNYFYNGFYAYVVSISLSLLWLSFWWNIKDKKTVANQVILSLGMCIIFTVHLAGFAAVFISYASYEFYKLIVTIESRYIAAKHTIITSSPIFGTFLSLYFFQQSLAKDSIESAIWYKNFTSKLMTAFYPFINFNKLLDGVMIVILLLTLAISIKKEFITGLNKNFLFILSCIFFFLFLITPTAGHGVYDFDCRFLPFGYFTLFASIGGKFSKRPLATYFICLILAVSFVSNLYYKRITNNELSMVWSLIEKCPPNKSIQFINSVENFPSKYGSRVSPFPHFFCYYIPYKGGIVSDLFDCQNNTNMPYFCYKNQAIAISDHSKFLFRGLSFLTDSDIKKISRTYDYVVVIDKMDEAAIKDRLNHQAFRLFYKSGYGYLFENTWSMGG